MQAAELADLLVQDLARVLPPDYRVRKSAKYVKATRAFRGGRVLIQLPFRGLPPIFRMGSVHAGIRFHAVQLPIEEVQQRHGVFIKGREDTVMDVAHQAAPDAPSFANQPVAGPQSYAEVFARIEQTLRQHTLPFIEQYSDLQRIHTRAMELPVHERSGFLGPEVPLQLMALKRLTGASDYESYTEQVLTFAVEAARDQPVQYRNYDRVVADLDVALRSL